MADTVSTDELKQLRQLFHDTKPTDQQTCERYAWVIVKSIQAHIAELGSVTCRQLLADYLLLPLPCPSRLHSAILSVATQMANTFPDFHFVTFLNRWEVQNIRPEDYEQPTIEGNTYPSLAERLIRAYLHALLLRPEETLPSTPVLDSLLRQHQYLLPRPMLVTRIKEAKGQDNRRYHFVTLDSPEGLQVECESHTLKPHPLHPVPEGKRHWVNIGQIYDVVLRQKKKTATSSQPTFAVQQAYISPVHTATIFPTAVGFIEHIDTTHNHIHIYDSQSRHFVASVQRYSYHKAGDFVRFIPVTPLNTRFKTAIITSAATAADFPLREIRITAVHPDKNYAVWQLSSPDDTITELLSPLQTRNGEISPSFTSGALFTDRLMQPEASMPTVGQSLKAIIFLKRGKDGQKHPFVPLVFT